MADRSDPPFDQGLFLVHLNRGKSHFENRRYGDAAEELQEARTLRPNDDTVLNLLGLSYFKQEKYKEADSIYRRLVEDHPESFTLHFNLGLIGFKLGNLDDAEATFLRSLEIRPDNQKVHFYLGNIYERKGQHYNAIFQYRKAGANIMVKRVQEKIDADAGERAATPHSDNDTSPNISAIRPTQETEEREQDTSDEPREARAPQIDDELPDAGSTLEVINIDTIDRSRFLSAIRDGVSGTAAAGTMPPHSPGSSYPAPAGVSTEQESLPDSEPQEQNRLEGEPEVPTILKAKTKSEGSAKGDPDRESDTQSFRVRRSERTSGDTIPPFEAESVTALEEVQETNETLSPPGESQGAESKDDLTLPPGELDEMLDTVVKLTEPVIHDQSLAEMARNKVPEELGPELFSEGPSATIPPVSTEPLELAPREGGRAGDRGRQLSFRRSSDEPYKRMRRKDDLFRYLEPNLIEVNFSGKVFIKQGTIYSYSGNLTFWVKPQREETVPPLVIVSGTGKLILTDGQREITVMRVNDEKIFVEPHHLLACQDTLTPRYASIERTDPGHTKLHVLAIEGSGLVALSVATSPLMISVKEEFPVNVSSANVISWSGGLNPAIVEDDALAELMLPNGRIGVNLRLSGEGQVMMEKHVPARTDD